MIFFQSPHEIPVLEKIRARERCREGSVAGFGTDLSGRRESATVGFDYMSITAAETMDGQLWFASAESAVIRAEGTGVRTSSSGKVFRTVGLGQGWDTRSLDHAVPGLLLHVLFSI